MKIIKLRGTPLISLYLGVATIILSLLVIALGNISFKSVKTLGNYSNKVGEEIITKAAFEIYLENTIKLAKMYSGVFCDAEKYSKILKDLYSHYLDHPDCSDCPNVRVSEIRSLFETKTTLTDSSKHNVSVCYWGDKKPASPTPPKTEAKAIAYLSKVTSAIEYFYPYSEEVWVNNFRDEYIVASPNFESRKIKVNCQNMKKLFRSQYIKFKKFYNKFPEKRNDPIWQGYTIKFSDSRKDMSIKYPIFDANKEFVGFAGIDINLVKLAKNILDEKYGSQHTPTDRLGQLFLLTNDTTVIAVPENIFNLIGFHSKEEIEKKLYFDPAYRLKLSDSKLQTLKNLTQQLKTKKEGVSNLKIENKSFFVTFSRIPVNQWILLNMAPMKNILLPIELTNLKMNNTISALLGKFFRISVIFVVLAIVFSYLFFVFCVNYPIKKLRDVVSKIGQGKFDSTANTGGPKEISDLAFGINKMSTELTEHLAKLKKETKRNQAIETELEIAGNIQKSILPKITGEFLRDELDIYANLVSAKYVSGDFYDLFFVNDDILAIVVADVTGKGISAAFFMSIAKIIIKNSCLQAQKFDPGDILEYVNSTLSKDNESCMFLSMYLLFYNVKTGELTFSNAGHHDIIKIDDSGNKSYFGKQGNAFVGIFENLKYKQENHKLKIGDTIILYTDGISEAHDPNDQQYGVERMIHILDSTKGEKLEKVGNTIINDVLKHELGSRFDDITLVMLKRLK